MQTAPRPGLAPAPVARRWLPWWRAIRPVTLLASVAPVAVGGALAYWHGAFDPWIMPALLLSALAIQAATNLANEYYDHVRGADSVHSPGPSRMIQLGHLTPPAVRRGMLAAFGLGFTLGLIIVGRAGWPILALGLAGMGIAWAYNTGPLPLSRRALGDPAVFVFMGPVMVGGTYYVHAGQLAGAALWASLPVGFLVVAILHANNVRDIDEDLASGKQTLANLLGRRRSGWYYLGLVYAAYLLVPVYVRTGILPPGSLVAWLTLPTAHRLVRTLRRSADRAELDWAVRTTARLHGRFGLLLALGMTLHAAL